MISEHKMFVILTILPLALAGSYAAVQRSTHRYMHTTHGPLDYLCTRQSESYLVPYPWSCHYFVECDGKGHSQIKQCADDLYFNRTTQLCDYPDLVDCQASTSPWPHTPTPTPDPGPLDELCAGKPDFWLVPYPYDCTKYLQCIKEHSVLQICDPGKYFDNTVRACNFIHLVHCTVSTFRPRTTTPIPTTTTKKPADPYCVGKPDRFIRPYPFDCTKFIECVDQTSQVLPCPQGFKFDVSKNKCMSGESVQCSPSTPATVMADAPTPASIVSDSITTCKGVADGTLFRYPTDCAKYIECEKDQAIVRTCPTGRLFDNVIKECNFDFNVNCDTF